MRANRYLASALSMCLAAGAAFGQPPAATGVGGAGAVPPAMESVSPMPVATASPGAPMVQHGLHPMPPMNGLAPYPGPGPEYGAPPHGKESGTPSGIPQAWAMSAFNPAPYLIIRTEAMFLKADFPRSESLALQPQVGIDGRFAIVERPMGIDGPYLVTPKVAVERFGCLRYNSFELSGWANLGPNRTTDLGNNDFPYFLGSFTDPNTGDQTLPALIGIPEQFPTIADRATFEVEQRIGNFELMWWRHFTPEKGGISDLAVGVGGRYMWMHEKVGLRFEDLLEGSTTPFGVLSARSKNDFFGLQLGAKAYLQSPHRRVRSFIEGKIGLLNNDARNDTSIIDSTDTVVASGRWTRSNFSPLFEASYNLEIFVSQFVTAFAGFNVIYVDRVERASEQFNSNLTTFISPQKVQSDLLLFGPKFGFVMNW